VAVNPELANPLTQQQYQFQRLYELILFGNRQMNLTRITDPLEFWENTMGFFTGIHPHKDKIDSSFKVIDIAQSRGFPGIPVAVTHRSGSYSARFHSENHTFLETLLAET